MVVSAGILFICICWLRHFRHIEVYAATIAQASAIGAAMAIHEHWNENPVPERYDRTETLSKPKRENEEILASLVFSSKKINIKSSMGVLLGVFLHFVGGFASGSFYIPYKKVKSWHWESYWLVGGLFSWLIAPIFAAWLIVPGFWDIIGSVARDQPFSGLISWAFYGELADSLSV